MRFFRKASLVFGLLPAAFPAAAQVQAGASADAATGASGTSAGPVLNSGSAQAIATPVAVMPALALSSPLNSPSAPAANSMPSPGSKASALAIPASVVPASARPDVRPYGVEFEYALTRTPADTTQIPGEAYSGALDAAAARFGLTGIPVVGPDLKFNFGHKTAEMPDFDGSGGHHWKAVPEETEGRLLDGVELVTPPLRGEADERALIETHRDLLKSGVYRRGYSSSAHITYDVSDLISKDGDVSRLVDAILFIEMNWPKLFAAASPYRYGTIVNRFTVPLAVDQPALLNELAALPRGMRSVENVRAIFVRHHAAEIALSGAPMNAWKMRAANYGKLFGLQQGYEDKSIPVIEFRVADLPEGEEFTRQRRLFDAVLSNAPHIDRFESPFRSGRIFSSLNEEIAAQDRGAYKDFLAKIGLQESLYPFLGRLGALPVQAAGGEFALHALRTAAAALPGGLTPALSAAGSAIELIDALLSSRDPVVRRFAAAALISRPDEELMPRAANLMDDDDESLRFAALDTLWGRHDDAVWPILEQASFDLSPRVRLWTYLALSNRDDNRAADILLFRGASDSDEKIRAWAWHGLGAARSTASAFVLEQLLAANQPEVIRDSAWTLLLARDDAAAREIVERRGAGAGALAAEAPAGSVSVTRRVLNWALRKPSRRRSP